MVWRLTTGHLSRTDGADGDDGLTRVAEAPRVGSSFAKERTQKATATTRRGRRFGLRFVFAAVAAIGGFDTAQNLLDVLAATGVRGLVAL